MITATATALSHQSVGGGGLEVASRQENAARLCNRSNNPSGESAKMTMTNLTTTNLTTTNLTTTNLTKRSAR
jgi:hypothetical protein